MDQESVNKTIEDLLDGALAICDAALARVWLVRHGDICPTCPTRSECGDQARCLHLVASAGATARLDGPYRRFPIGAREVGSAVVRREPFIARDGLHSMGIADAAWLELHRVRSFAAVPLVHGDLALGVLAVFSRRPLTDAEITILVLAAAQVAAAMAADEPDAGIEVPSAPRAARRAERRGSRTLAEIEREAIASVLERTGGRVSGTAGAAKILGLHPSTLTSRMIKLGVPRTRKGRP